MTLTENYADTALPTRRLHRGQILSFLRAAGIALLAGMVGGVVWGIGARAAMRVVALAANHRPEFSWEGSLAILMLGAFGGTLVSLPYLAVRRIVPGGWRRRGLAFGPVVLLVLGYLVYASPPFQEEIASTGQLGLAIALFAPLLVIYGIVVAAVYEPLDQRILRATRRRLVAGLSIALLVLPLIYAAGIGVLIYLTSTGQVRL